MRKLIIDIRNAVLIGTLIYIIIMFVLYIMGTFDQDIDLNRVWQEYYLNMIPSILLYFANTIVWRFFESKFAPSFQTAKLILGSFAAHLGVSFIAIFISRAIIFVGVLGRPIQTFLADPGFDDYYISLLITLVVLIIFHSFYFYKRRQENKVKEQKIIAGTASAKFDALKNQLDPHFLFNSLNVLTSLIEEDPYQAQKFTTSLSKVYRYVLEQKNKDLVSVDEELQFAKTYVRLLKMRFEESIVFEIPDKCSNPDAKIIPLSLQLLLENAVKHNVVTSDKPLHIKVYEDEGELVVSNNLQEKQVVKKSSGVGLTNIQQRYAILTNREVEISKSPSDFSVKLPMLTKQVSQMKTQKVYIEDKRYEKAKERVQAIKGFYGNLFAYCLVIPILIFINYQTTSFPWAIFPTLGWGFGVTAHGFEAFGYSPLFGKGWEERKMREFMDDENF